jgi:hypothetical protein
MVWIKRNLFFVLSVAVGVLLVLGAGYYLWTNYNENITAQNELETKHNEFAKYAEASPQPTKEMVTSVKDQQKEIETVLAEFKKHMGGGSVEAGATTTNAVGTNAPGTNAPGVIVPVLKDEHLAAEVSRTLVYLQAAATNSGVNLPPQYYFTFGNLINRLSFNSNSLAPFITQLHEVRNLCDVMFAAKVNTLDGLRRVPAGIEDVGGGEYLPCGSVTNESGIHTPYEISFRAYTAELQDVVNGFLRSTNGFTIKYINIEPGAGGISYSSGSEGGGEVQNYSARRRRPRGGMEAGADAMAAVVPTNQGPVTIVSEKLVKVTMIIDVVKPKAQ